MKIYSKTELKNSRLFFDKMPPSYFSFLGYFFIAVLVIGVFSLKFIPKNSIVRAQGTIEASDKQFVTPLINGHLVAIHFKEGDKVKKGDRLLTLSSGAEGTQEEEIQRQIESIQERKKVFAKYEKSLQEKKNYLKNKEEEQEFYGKVEYFLSQVRADEKTVKNNQEKIADKEQELVILEQAFKKTKEESKKQYQKEYQRKLDDSLVLDKKIKSLQEQLEKRNEKTVSDQLKTEIDTYQKEQKQLTQEMEDLTDTTEKQLETETKTKNEEIKNKKLEIKELKEASDSQSDGTFQQLISELGTLRTQTQDKLSELTMQKNIKTKDTKLHYLTAPNDGVIHYLTPLKEGIGLQAFQPIGQIDNGLFSELVAESYISAQDRSKVHIGDEVKIAFHGVNQTKFGLLRGKIKQIGNGTISQNSGEQTQLLYQVQVELYQTQLKSGEKIIPAKASMPIIASIVYEKEMYLDWVLEQLNFMKEH